MADCLLQANRARGQSKRPIGFEAQPGLAPGGLPPKEGPNVLGQMPLLKPHEFRRTKGRRCAPSPPPPSSPPPLPLSPSATAPTSEVPPNRTFTPCAGGIIADV